MLLLPAFNARLLPCSEAWAAMTPNAQGRHCARCQRVVLDFSHSTDPTADLAAARADMPDGRACGRFSAAQVQGPRPLTRRLRWFLVALVLVVAQGLSAREALAQVRQGASHKTSHKTEFMKLAKPVRLLGDVEELPDKKMLPKPAQADLEELKPKSGPQAYLIGEATAPISVTRYERMPSFQKRGFNSGAAGMMDYIQQNVRQSLNFPEGRVYVTFTVDTTGQVRDPAIVKGLSPTADAEVIRVVQAMNGFAPGMSHGRPVAIPITLPITFKKPEP